MRFPDGSFFHPCTSDTLLFKSEETEAHPLEVNSASQKLLADIPAVSRTFQKFLTFTMEAKRQNNYVMNVSTEQHELIQKMVDRVTSLNEMSGQMNSLIGGINPGKSANKGNIDLLSRASG
ncbi:hypothetical protein Q7A53_14810 [Halobacillus rhizosphaerae]|uniref:hypothetical protein n=1 Tax=Halobacillus rhizosphaerae TaxID=3064889 RepID=UPI00398BA684